jgi:hypothetical protein
MTRGGGAMNLPLARAPRLYAPRERCAGRGRARRHGPVRAGVTLRLEGAPPGGDPSAHHITGVRTGTVPVRQLKCIRNE